MADFDNFESAVPENDVEEDPAAAFLANEREQFAGLEDDLPNGELNDHGYDQVNSMDNQYADINSMISHRFDDEFETGGMADSDHMNGFDYSNDTTNGDDAYGAISQVDKNRKEPEKIRKWREEQKIRLEKKDKESEEKKAEWKEVAKKELEDWYKKRADQFIKTQETNRAHENAFIHERDVVIPGNEWESICRLCDFNPKNSKHSKDVSRLRSVLLQLKQTPLQR